MNGAIQRKMYYISRLDSLGQFWHKVRLDSKGEIWYWKSDTSSGTTIPPDALCITDYKGNELIVCSLWSDVKTHLLQNK